jgi:Zn-dependent M28 family amino/carboxypeptidase
VFEKAGLDIDKMRTAANKRGFKPVPMTGLKLSAAIKQTVAKKDSRNVVGTLKGATHPDEHVLYVAHWDHLGKSDGGAEGEDVINNGAVDNATGVAMILDIAEKFASEPPQPRSVTFMAVTLEESGLLGSAYFADKPFIPLNKIVGGINIDAMNPMGKTKDVVVVGAGASELEDVLKDVLDTQGRKAVPDPHPESGSFYRSDHISLSKKGVPMLYVDGGVDAVDGGVAKGEAVAEEYVANAYHSPKDEYKDDWDFSGLQQEAETSYEVGRRMATENFWPNWYKGNEFRALRDKMMGDKIMKAK